jgi:hypothetical protein
MLEIHKPFKGKTTTDSPSGNTNIFLRNILVEAVAENYKQMLHEWLFLSDHKDERLLDPPIRANERVMSGLFGSAITAIAERSRPEVRIDRGDIQAQDQADSANEDEDTEPKKASKVGRIDYLAWYAQRTFAIELKMGSMNCDSCAINDNVKNKWGNCVDQAANAQAWLRLRQKEDRQRYPNPISLALMVVVGRRSLAGNSDIEGKIVEKRDSFTNALLQDLKPHPQFGASYTFPEDFRRLSKRRHGAPSNGQVYVPFIAFIARSAVNT